MKRIVLLILLLSQMLSGKILSASYEVSYGIFQTMGTADARFEIKDDQTYSIRIEAKTTGIAKFLSNNRIESYESYGNVINGRLVPLKYVKVRQTDSKKTIKIYTFDHSKQKVWKENIHSDEWDKVEHDFYAAEDILTLFFNLNTYTQSRQDQIFYAIGGSGKDGRINVVFPKNEVLQGMKKTLEMNEGDFLKVILNDRIFASSNGELLINLGKDGLCDKAVLADVLLFGDIIGKRVR
ncbi:DUF3108 domain-containing protein [Sulfuricurvum sp.]|uniref:DUF3108 domain-containing protein n=1 Tax=Sulfuricurvum sp. TaxID=2025608 RepID=UPI003BB06E0B